ncbi:MAG: hypothetical protein ACK5MY_05020 [Jhaorihella sp.]
MTTGTAGTVFFGPEGLSNFGRKVRNIGDINHDGIADFAVSAPHAGNGYDGPGDSIDRVGIVYVFYGRDGDFGESFDLDFDGTVQPDGVMFSVIQGDLASGRIGDALNPAGDINHDGIDDLVVGSDVYGESGAAFVYFGAEGGLPAVSVIGAVGGGSAWVGLSAAPGDQFGIEAEGIGDFDGDGFADLYVSSQNDHTVEIHFGAATLFDGRLDITGAYSRGAAIGDINGDGLGDIAVQAEPSGDPVILLGGAGWGPGTIDLGTLDVDGSNGFRLAAGNGWTTEGVGDVNGDGIGDLLYITYDGMACLVFGRETGFPALIAPEDLDGSNGMRLTGTGASFQIGGTGDINGDGLRDFVLGDPNSGAGNAFILFGRRDGHPAELDLTTLDGSDGYRLQGVNEYDRLAGGQLGDFNNDGFADLIAGAALFDAPGDGGRPVWNVGAAVLVYGGPERLRAFDAADGDADGVLHLTHVGDSLTFTEPDPVPVGGDPGVTREGTSGDDVLVGGAGADLLRGLDGNDRLIGEGGNDTLEGGDGADTLNGGDGDDLIRGGDTAADKRDVVYAGAGNDSVDGGYGNDHLYGMGGNDTLAGGFGADTIEGQDGDDVITGSAYSDIIWGGAGDDFINGGFGHDLLMGDVGADKFFHVGGTRDQMEGHGSDWIMDFAAADLLVFGDATARADQFQVNFTHTENAAGERSGDDATEEAFVIYKPTGQILWALVDGGGQASINLQIGAEVYDLLA